MDNWAGRKEGMVCGTCKYYVPKANKTLTEIGRCRRRAPTLNGYPVVYSNDWCGDHKLDEA